MNWEYTDGQSVAVTLSRSERAPSQQELFSAGQHLATESYEVGLVFDMDDEGHIEDELRDVNEEVSTNLDVTFRKFTGDWGYSVSFFYNQADDYIFQSNTGLLALTEHEEHDEDDAELEEDHSDEDTTPVYYFQQADADIWGVEAEAYVDLNDAFRLTVFSDYINAEVEDDNLPRTPPMRFGSELSYVNDGLTADVGLRGMTTKPMWLHTKPRPTAIRWLMPMCSMRYLARVLIGYCSLKAATLPMKRHVFTPPF